MTVATKPQLTLDEFLQLPETNPASEFLNGIELELTVEEVFSWLTLS